jgi:hypothetical protein
MKIKTCSLFGGRQVTFSTFSVQQPTVSASSSSCKMVEIAMTTYFEEAKAGYKLTKMHVCLKVSKYLVESYLNVMDADEYINKA